MSKPQTTFEKMLRGYLGFLEGRGKSMLTVSSYRGDLLVFKDFLEKHDLEFLQVTTKEFDLFHHFLKKRGLKTNTRRRKLITARALYRYALTRNKIEVSPVKFTRPPDRVEKLPWIPSVDDVANFQKSAPVTTALGLRNRILIQMLIETGMTISELCALRWDQLEEGAVQVAGKRARKLALSEELRGYLAEWYLQMGEKREQKFLFPGFNRHGITTPKMTPRGVEILFALLAEKTGLPELKPKSLRHHVVVQWLARGVDDKEILRRLGVNPSYSLLPYKEYLRTSGSIGAAPSAPLEA